MSNQTNRTKITGSVYSLKSSIIFIAVFAFIISFLLMGTAFPRFFIVLFVSLTGLNLVTYAVARRTNWFEFDDENKRIVKAFRHRIPYDKITAIVISEVWRGVAANVKIGRLQICLLATGLSKEQAELAEKEFIKRFPLGLIRKKSYSRKRLAIIVAIALLIVIIVSANFLYRMHQMVPSEVVTAEKKDWMSSTKPTEEKQYQINGIDFRLPDSFIQVKQEKSWFYFEDNSSKTKVNVGPGLWQNTDFIGSALGRLIGVRDDYNFYQLAYTARFGLLPTLAKSSAFRQLFEIKLYEISRGKLRGIVLQGMKGNKSVAEIIVADKETGLHFFVSRPGEIGKIPEDLLKSIAASIQAAD